MVINKVITKVLFMANVSKQVNIDTQFYLTIRRLLVQGNSSETDGFGTCDVLLFDED